jgi:hypothetical protein
MDRARTAFDAHHEKCAARQTAETAGHVADSLVVRMDLMARVEAGELTLAQVQAELKQIKRGAKAAGNITRAQAYSRG